MASPAPFQFLPLGAIIQTFYVGKTNIVQGFPTAELYQKHNGPFFGETIGRVANRIKGAKLDSLNGKSYALAANNGPNSLHGGNVGWGKRVWAGPTPVGQREIPGLEGGKLTGGESVKFTLKSQDGEEGFPGDLEVSVIYTAGTQLTPDGKEVNVLAMEYQAELVGGADETVINMTNHSYFNLSGEPTIAGTDIELSTNLYLPVDEHGIPTGGPQVYDAADLSKVTLGVTEPDVDDCFVFDAPPNSIPIDTREQALKKLVTAYHPRTKIHLEVLATEPAFQFYTGKYIDVPSVEGLPARGARSGFCVEPSRFVNAANVDEWKGQVLLKKGEVYGSRTVYRGWSDE
ncbi:hypothetical protein V500_09570 [Pseudogymnoascus sp. VKM F-4518 (FW-2643)]|nr:hypothetical protein V500_09570 [Pseudogymnoascus sp. VKM F-4518 (FW-2643)]